MQAWQFAQFMLSETMQLAGIHAIMKKDVDAHTNTCYHVTTGRAQTQPGNKDGGRKESRDDVQRVCRPSPR